MRTDLKINYAGLEMLSDQIEIYYKALENMEDSLEDLKEVLEEQESSSVYELSGNISAAVYSAGDKQNTLKQIKEILDNYIMDMQGLLKPIKEEENVRADQYDIWYNMKQIEGPIKDISRDAKVKCSGNYHTVSVIETSEEKSKREKEERNYKKLENFRQSILMAFADNIDKKLENMWKIYNENVKPFEETDDVYRKSLNKLYNACTDTGDKILDGLCFVGKVALIFIATVGEILVAAWALAQLPTVLAVGIIVLPIAGCIILASVPKEYVPSWLEAEKENADEIIKTVKEGPVAIVEAIGQGLADTVQTPEGIAVVSGTVVGLVLVFKGSKKKTDIDARSNGTRGNRYSDEEIENIMKNLRGDGFKNNPLRQAYEREVAGLKAYGEELLASGMSEAEVAEKLNQARRALGVKYKDMTPQPLRDYIYEINRCRYDGDELGPTYKALRDAGRSDMDIINSSSKPNGNIDKLLSGFEEWLRRQ